MQQMFSVDYSSAINDDGKFRSSVGLVSIVTLLTLNFTFAQPIAKETTDKTRHSDLV